jgi:5'-3' exonuclease
MMNLAFRVHYTRRNLTSEGRPTSILYGIPTVIHDLRETISKQIIFVWDHGVPIPGAVRSRNWREEFLPVYKSQRKHDDEEYARIVEQLPELSKVINWLGYDQAAVMGLEADDLMGILSHEIPSHILLFSTDRDLYQLIGPRTEILVPKKDKGDFRVLPWHEIEEEFGVPIDRWAEYLALGGDKSDNIKPQKGMGPKTAAKLIADGINLRKPRWADQSPEFRTKYSKLESIWPAILNSYKAARIPTNRKDPRLLKYLPQLQKLKVSPQQRWRDEATRRQAEQLFARFCADRDMVTLLQLRRNLFRPCPLQNQNHTLIDTSSRSNRRSGLSKSPSPPPR